MYSAIIYIYKEKSEKKIIFLHYLHFVIFFHPSTFQLGENISEGKKGLKGLQNKISKSKSEIYE